MIYETDGKVYSDARHEERTTGILLNLLDSTPGDNNIMKTRNRIAGRSVI